LHFAEPLLVAPVRLASGEEPPAGPVRELTAQIERALAEVTLQAEQTEVHALVERAQRIFTAQDDPPETPPTLREGFDLPRRFVATGLARGADDALASIKVLAAMLLFPLTWAGTAVAMWRWRGVEAALWTVVSLPLAAYAALAFVERLDRLIGGARALGLFLFK